MQISAALLATLAFMICTATDRLLSWQTFARPLVAGPITGLLLGDLQTGIIMGASLEAIFMGISPIGGTFPADTMAGTVICVSYTIITKSDVETGLAISLPIATLMATVNELYKPVLSALAPFWERLAGSGDTTKFRRLSIVSAVLIDRLAHTVILFLAIAFGVESLQSLFNTLPAFVMAGLSAASSMMTAVGFAILTSMIWNAKIGIFLAFGFVLSKYLGLDALPIAIIGSTFAFMYYAIIEHMKKNTVHIAKEQSNEEEENFF